MISQSKVAKSTGQGGPPVKRIAGVTVVVVHSNQRTPDATSLR
jgi:hypothetical protein